MKQTFDQWMKEVEATINWQIDKSPMTPLFGSKKLRLRITVPWKDWYDEGLHPVHAVNRAIKRYQEGAL